jgi:hypothetical protein
MKEILAASGIVLLCGIADAKAEDPPTGTNVIPVVQRNAPYYSRRRYRYSRYNRGPVRQTPYGTVTVGRGPYPGRLLPDGTVTGPEPLSGGRGP